jgi:hypothetical protein
MCMLMYWLGLARIGIVDRIEGPSIIVEWNIDEFSEIPSFLFPKIQEGDKICLIKTP